MKEEQKKTSFYVHWFELQVTKNQTIVFYIFSKTGKKNKVNANNVGWVKTTPDIAAFVL